MKVDFDNMRVQTVHNFNRVVETLKSSINDDGDLRLDEFDLGVLDMQINDLRMNLVCLAFLSGENETFSEIPESEGLKFAHLELEQ